MSYLPRMSKTYKEPPQPLFLEDNLPGKNTLQPASSLLNETTYNPQATLKHYKYLPHPPPVLPGPSVLEEALENELFREASKQRRSMSGSVVSEFSKSRVNILTPSPSIATIFEDDLKPEESTMVKQSHSKRMVKGSRSSISRKKSSKVNVDKKKDYDGMVTDTTINVCLVNSDCAEPFTSAQTERNYRSEHENENKKRNEFLDKNELSYLKREKSAAPLSYLNISDKTQTSIKKTLKKLPSKENISEVKFRDVINRSIQCTIFGSAEKKIVISPVIHSLLRALAFLLRELNKEEVVNKGSGEKKRLLTQIQLILGDLSNQAIDQEFTFDMSYSDSKRIEKILSDLQRYIKDTYGTKGEMLSKLDDMKKIFIETKMKEMELGTLNEKLEEKEFLQTTEVKDRDLKHPEITLQNKKLESEQLLAEVEFSSREIKNYQKSIAEIEWEIKNNQDKLCNLKKSYPFKSKNEALGKKVSMLKLTNENQTKDYKNKESDSSRKKKP